MRFVAPSRSALDASVLDHPVFDDFHAFLPWLRAPEFPSIDALNAGWSSPHRFVAQTDALLADGLHYEQRIFDRGEIATRANWHDLFNAMMWRRHYALKCALNRRQVQEIGVVGPKQRSRAQCALTHFDEGGAIVVLRDVSLLPLWDAHDWHGLFWRERAAWSDGRIRAIVVGHALLEHALQPDRLFCAKCLVVDGSGADADDSTIAAQVAHVIASAGVLSDPQELRTLPLSGIPKWHARTGDEAFYAEGDCFRPLRAGRRYPAPIALDAIPASN